VRTGVVKQRSVGGDWGGSAGSKGGVRRPLRKRGEGKNALNPWKETQILLARKRWKKIQRRKRHSRQNRPHLEVKKSEIGTRGRLKGRPPGKRSLLIKKKGTTNILKGVHIGCRY